MCCRWFVEYKLGSANMFVPVAAEMCQLIAISCLLTQDMRYIMCFFLVWKNLGRYFSGY